jgi:hypothetical protein
MRRLPAPASSYVRVRPMPLRQHQRAIVAKRGVLSLFAGAECGIDHLQAKMVRDYSHRSAPVARQKRRQAGKSGAPG